MKRIESAIARTVIAVSGLTLALGAAAQAQLEEVVVTATKKEQNLQDVAISVQVVGGESIENSNIVNMEDLTNNLPATTVSQTVGGNSIYMRGIGSGGSPGFQQSVGTFVDGIYMGRAPQSRASFLDIQRIEVLRGPQSTYFGNNTIGGALNVITRNPGDEFAGSVGTTYTPGDDELTLDAAIGGPISDTLSARLALRYYDLGGWMTNSVQGWTTGESSEIDVPQSENISGRLTLSYRPSDELDFTFKAEAGDNQEKYNSMELFGCTAELAAEVGPRRPGQGPLGARANCNTDTLEVPGYEANFDLSAVQGGTDTGFDKVYTDLQINNYSLNINYDMGGYQLTSVSGLSSYESDRGIDPDAGPWDSLHAVRTEDFDQFSQELRITSPEEGPFTFLAGVYYDTTDLETGLQNREPAIFGGGPNAGQTNYAGGVGYAQVYNEDTESLAVFGAGTWQLTDTFSATLGLRYTEVDKEGVLDTVTYRLVDGEFGAILNCNVIQGPPCVGPTGSRDTYTIAADRTFDDFNQSIDFQWFASSNVMLYGGYRNGFKAGGYDPLVTNEPRAIAGGFEYESEEVDAYEVGAKTNWMDNSLTINVALFSSEYENLQTSVFDPATLSFFIQNAAKSTSEGLEVDGRWAINEYFTLSTNLTFLDAKYEKWLDEQTGEDVVPEGEPTEFAPDYSGNLNLRYRTDLGLNLELTADLKMNFTDDYKTSTSVNDVIVVGGYERYDLRIALASPDVGWELALVGKNISDEEVWRVAGSAVQSAAGSFFAFADRGRSVAIQANYRF